MMERLTEYVNGVALINKNKLDFHFETGVKIGGDIADRLAAYEDTGLEPQEITNLITRMVVGITEFEKLTEVVNDIGGWGVVGSLARAKHDGRLVEMPCKEGDTINLLRGGKVAASDTVTQIIPTKRGFTVHTKKEFRPIKTGEYDIAPICKYPYALADFYIGTRDEAEAALKEAASCTNT